MSSSRVPAGRAGVDAAETAKILWETLVEIAQENLFRNFLEPTAEERDHLLSALILLPSHIFQNVLTSTFGQMRQNVADLWIHSIKVACEAREKAEEAGRGPGNGTSPPA